MEKLEFDNVISYWDTKVKKLCPKERIKEIIDEYILKNNTCALATGTNDYIRCTPIEYIYDKKKFYMFSEGGHKFIGLKTNDNVSLAIYDKYDGFNNLSSLQIQGKARIIPFDDKEYLYACELRHLSLDALKKLPHQLILICVEPSKIDALFTKFKSEGYDSRQEYIFGE